MRKMQKTLIFSVVSALTFSLGATPALAQPVTEFGQASEAAAVASQSLNTEIDTSAAAPLDTMLTVASTKTGPEHGFDVDAAIAQAKLEIGTSRATGWAQPGECIMSTNRWIRAGGGNWTTGGTPVTNYANATRLPVELAEPGDVIQYENLVAPHAWVMGVHTVLVTGVNGDGTLQIVESNNPGGSGLVTMNESWTPAPPEGFQAVAWRF